MGKTKAAEDSKKGASKKGSSRKVLVDSPWKFGVHTSTSTVKASVVSDAVNKLLEDLGFSEWSDKRRVRVKCLDEVTKKRFCESKKTLRSLWAIGFNEVVRSLQNGCLSFVIAPAQSKPPHLLEALALCCNSSHVPVILLDDMQTVAKLFKVSSSFALGVKTPQDAANLSADQKKTNVAHRNFISLIAPYAAVISSDLPQLLCITNLMSRGSTSSCSEEPIDEGEEKFHPFIQAELETLNLASQSVNTLEARLDETRILFLDINKERTAKLDEIVKKLGKCVEKARPYYEAKSRQKAIQSDVQKAAQMFERACSTVDAAKEMVQLAEQSVINIGTLDGDWQEVLNHATERVLKAERDKEESERVHRKHAEDLTKVAIYCSSLERSVKNCITKSATYFELLQSYNDKLETKKQEIRELEISLQSAKQTYSLALSTLENISNIIHKRRQALREKRLHQDGEPTNGNLDPLLLDVPDLLRQLSVSSHHHHQQQHDISRLETSSASSLLTTVQTAQQNSTSASSSNVSTSHISSPFTYPPSARPVPVPLKNNATIRAGVVIDASDLLRSVGLLHLANNVSTQTPQQQQQQYNYGHHANQQQALRQQPQWPSKGLTSSSSSYSLQNTAATSTATQPSSHSPSSRSARQRNNVREPTSARQPSESVKPHPLVTSTTSTATTATIPASTIIGGGSNSSNNDNNNNNNGNSSTTVTTHQTVVMSWPSPSLSEVSSASSTAGIHHRRRDFRHDHSGRSSEAEDLPGEDSAMPFPDGSNSISALSANSILVITPVSLDAGLLNPPGTADVSHSEEPEEAQ